MPVTTPPALSDIPAFPALSERAAGTYNANAYACLNHWASTGGPQLEALAGNVFDNATEAAAAAAAVGAQVDTATTQAGIASAAAIAADASADAAVISQSAAAGSAVAADASADAAALSAAAAHDSELAAAASAASIAGGPVASVNGETGVVTLSAADVGAATASDISTAVSNERTATVTLTNKTLTAPTFTGAVLNDGYTEEVFSISGTTPALSPTNGSIQTWTLTGNSTPTAGTWAAGQSITLMVADGTAYTITWTSVAVTWVGGTAPTLATSGFTVIVLWKVGSTIYGVKSGEVA